MKIRDVVVGQRFRYVEGTTVMEKLAHGRAKAISEEAPWRYPFTPDPDEEVELVDDASPA